jgi:hypothetical protein
MNFYPDQKVYENKRVVLITGSSSKWYEQAIFIIRKDAGRKAPPTDFVKEAESIIDNYMKTLESGFDDTDPPRQLLSAPTQIVTPAKPKRSRGLDWMINLTMLAAAAFLVYLISTRLF